ncbi:MAG: nucleoside-diphosphate kinase [Planctomycetia bacterium]|nr:nucleoside-diphosphate kinase [Planctomycetia bacterium]
MPKETHTIAEQNIEESFVLLKPDALERGLLGEILARLERKGLRLTRVKLLRVSHELARRHYAHLVDKPFFAELLAYITRGQALATTWRGRNAVSVIRQLVGATDPSAASPGSIRGDFALDQTENLIHASDSIESARKEIENFFPEA